MGGGLHLRSELSGFCFCRPGDRCVRTQLAGWRVSNSTKTDLVLDAVEQALHARSDTDELCIIVIEGLSTSRSVTASAWPSVESSLPRKQRRLVRQRPRRIVIGLYRTEVIRRCGPWRNIEAVEFATLEWVDWFNNRRLLEPIGNVAPAEFEQAYYRRQEAHALAA